jgi:O-antigen/teichoic acid export membrane protein
VVTTPDAPERDRLDEHDAGRLAVRGGIVRASGYVAGTLLSAASVPLMTRHLGRDDYGRYVTVVTIILIVAALSDVGVTNIAIREYALRSQAERSRLIRNVLGMRMALTALGVALAVAFTFVAGYPETISAGVTIVGVALFLVVIQATYQLPLSNDLRLNWVAALELVRQAVTVAAIVLLVIAGASLGPFYLVTFAGGLAALIPTMLLIRGRIPLRPAFERREWLHLVRDAPAYAVASAIGFVYFRVEVVLISLIGTEAQTGDFGVAFRIVEIVAGIPLLASVSLFPLLTRAGRDDRARLSSMVERMTAAYLAVGGGIAVGLVVGAPFAIKVAAGPGYDDAVDVLRVMGAAMAFTFLISSWSFALLARRRHAALLFANVGALLLAIVATLLLVPDHGAVGAATAAAITEVVLATTYAILLLHPSTGLSTGLRACWPVPVAAGLALAAAFVSHLPSFLAMALALAIYGGVLLLLGAVPQEAIAAFRAVRNDDG